MPGLRLVNSPAPCQKAWDRTLLYHGHLSTKPWQYLNTTYNALIYSCRGGSGSLYGIFGPAKELLDTDPSLAARTSNLNKVRPGAQA